MKNEILSNLGNPVQLERLYRSDKSTFKQAFQAVYPGLRDDPLAGFWQARLQYAREELSRGTGKELVWMILTALLAGVIAKLPAFLPIGEDFFYTRNAGFILFPLLTAYFARVHKLPTGNIALLAGATLAGLLFINALPDSRHSDTLLLSCIHLPLFLWFLLGIAFTGTFRNTDGSRLDFLKYNGDLIVMTTLILLAGGILTGLTIGLFGLIGMNIEQFYFGYVAIFGLAASPIVSTYLIRTNPQLVGRVSPLIARIFSPLVLVMLVIYLLAIVYSGKDPYNDREFLLMFNALLLGVMAIIFFSVAETSATAGSRGETWVLFGLSLITVVVNGIALSAILFRISAWGITPNRAAVLGSNVLMLLHLLMVTAQLYRVLNGSAGMARVRNVIASYLPVYFIWVTVVTFLFPFLFGLR